MSHSIYGPETMQQVPLQVSNERIIKILYIPANPVSRRRHFRNLPFVQAKRVFFSFHSETRHFNLRPPMNLSTCILRGMRSVLRWLKKYRSSSLAGARSARVV